jgi:endonuclease/exonuclease/phosphatase family metal-dependent hydrolase
MVFYNRIKSNTTDGKRTAERLLRLREALQREIPQRDIAGSLVLASWNIREFDSAAYGARKDEPLYYIAEIIDHFDLVAVQEVRDDLTALERLMDLLGWWWNYLLTDVTEGDPGNRERMAFLYDSRKVRFGGLAGEVVIPPSEKEEDGKTLEPAKQLARTPYITGFGVDWFKCQICTTHILYGEGVAEDPDRLEEIRVLARFLADRAKEEHAWAKNMILLGDFNIFDTSDQTMQAILEAGFTIPEKLQGHPSNAPKTRHYDQIAFIAPELEDRLELSEAGVFDYYQYVYREEDEPLYVEDMGEAYLRKADGTERTKQGRTSYYRTYWRTYQMSDHLPMWIELKTDFGEEYLKGKARLQT